MPFADANGQKLYYESHGEGEPLVAVMGLGADHLAWALQLGELSQHYRTIIFDNRDVGQSSYVESSYDVADMATDTLALADALELDTFHLLGVSLGGAISQELALSAPERVRTLTLAVTFAGGGHYAVEKSRLWGAAMMRASLEEQIENMMLLVLSESFYEQPEAVQFVKQMILANPHPQAPEAFARQLEAVGRHDTRERLGSLAMPVHVIAGEHDILLPLWKSEELAELIPGAKLSVIEQAPHGLNLERPQDFNRAVLEFLAEHRAAAAEATS